SAGALSITAGPVEFMAFDGQPVRIVFLLVGPRDAQSIHIRTLSRISRIMNNDQLRQRILDADSPQVVFDIIAEAEKAILEA
ncbi:MAG: mannitol/fructose-specific phosphotransferase system IIA component (Ntr-type), partial [Rhodothermales bacterium]